MPSREARKAAGKALRDKCSRGAHATFKLAPNRHDPVDLLIQSSEGRIPQLVPIRYGRMVQSPFAFYRGAASIMAADLARTPRSGPRIQACGDCHLLNFGGFATPERRLIFDINDFDETLPAPWEWDVKRLAASFVIAGRTNGLGKADARAAAARCVRSYRERLLELSDLRVIDCWYQRLDIEEIVAGVRAKKWRRRVQRYIEKQTSRLVLEDDFPKLAQVKNGRARIKDNPPLIFRRNPLGPEDHARVTQDAFHRYRATLPDDLKSLVDHYEIRDVAIKVVGVGSVGTRCGILLMMAGEDDPLFLQVKEARTSVLEPYAGKSRYPNRGQRIVAGQRMMQAASDIFLGWTALNGRHFYFRQLRDMKIKPVIEVMEVRALGKYADWCGWALAHSHARSGDAAMISGYIGTSPRFDEAVARFAVAYADQNEWDHQAMLKAVRAGKIRVFRE
jgi:uncharacterized protein (DUF2252 family)